VGVAVGVGFATSAATKKSGAACTPASCTPDGRTDLEDAGRAADIATGSFIAGAALIAAGTVLWFTAGRSPSRGAPSSR
jgi:hypothetical protein